jgi:hypothetical protein
MRQSLEWEPFFEIAREEMPYRERLAAYAAIARDRFEAERFEEFCAGPLGDLDEIAWEFYGGDRAREAVRLKVEALFPAHEVDRFTDHFWGLIQFWRKTERDRSGPAGA